MQFINLDAELDDLTVNKYILKTLCLIVKFISIMKSMTHGTLTFCKVTLLCQIQYISLINQT